MEDAVYLEDGVKTKGNKVLMAKGVHIIGALGGKVATVEHARGLLGLKSAASSLTTIAVGTNAGWMLRKSQQPAANRDQNLPYTLLDVAASRTHALCNWRAIKALTISCARSVSGPGSSTQRWPQPSKTATSHSPPAAR